MGSHVLQSPEVSKLIVRERRSPYWYHILIKFCRDSEVKVLKITIFLDIHNVTFSHAQFCCNSKDTLFIKTR